MSMPQTSHRRIDIVLVPLAELVHVDTTILDLGRIEYHVEH